MEQWKNIPGFNGAYQISNEGRVRSTDRFVYCDNRKPYLKPGVILAVWAGKTSPYLQIKISYKSKIYHFMIHRMVAVCFLGLNPKSKKEVNHKNGNKLDNRVENLEVVTHQQNIQHSVDTGLKHDYGERHVHAKLTNKQAEGIRLLHSLGVKQVRLADAFGVCKQTICRIVNNNSYTR